MKGCNLPPRLHAKEIEHAKIGSPLLLTSYLEITGELAAISLGRVSKTEGVLHFSRVSELIS